MIYSIDPQYTTRKLTSDEESLMDRIACQELRLGKSLFYQISDLMSHTMLILSGENRTSLEISDSNGIREDIDAIDKILGSLNDEVEDTDITLGDEMDDERPNDVFMIREWLDGQRQELDNCQDAEPRFTKLLGEYFPDTDVVKLYVNNIEQYANCQPDVTRRILAYVMVHEFFHAFFSCACLGVRDYFPYAEEPMAEFGSLCLLSALQSKSTELDRTFNCALNEVLAKRYAAGKTAAYGFGYYLFEHKHHSYKYLLARYANISHLIDPNSDEAIMYKFMLYPCYSPYETITFKRLELVIEKAWKLECSTDSILASETELVCRVTQAKYDEFRNGVQAANPQLSQDQIDMVAEIRFALRQHPKVGFTYIKTDKNKDYCTYRHAIGTTGYDFIPSTWTGKGGNARYNQYDTISYYDLEINDWRSFHISSLVSIDLPVRIVII